MFTAKPIVLSELKELPIIDFQKQTEPKNLLDDFIFSLYFNIPLTEIGFDKAEEIKEKCRANKYYQIVNEVRILNN